MIFSKRKVVLFKRLGIIAAFGVVAVALAASSLLRPVRDLDVKRLTFHDDFGKVRMLLSVAEDGVPRVQMFDEKGRKLVTLGESHAHSAALTIYQGGEPRLQLSTLSAGPTALKFLNSRSESETSMYLLPDDSTGVTMLHHGRRLAFGFQPDGTPALRLLDEGGQETGYLALTPMAIERLGANVKSAESSDVKPATSGSSSNAGETVDGMGASGGGTADTAPGRA